MPVVATEDFSGANNTTLQGKTTTTGGLTWATAGAFAPDQQGLKLNGSGLGKNSSTNGCLAYLSAGSNNYYSQVEIFGTFPASFCPGVSICCVNHQNHIHLSPSFSSGVLDLRKLVANASTVVATISGLTIPSGSVLRLERDDTTKKVIPYLNGVAVGAAGGYTVSDAVFDGVPNAGLWSKLDANSQYDNFEIGTVGSAATLGIGDGPVANRVYQRAPGTTSKAITLSGTYSGTAPTDIQYQLETAAGAVITAWTTASGVTIGSGAFSGLTVTVAQNAAFLILKLRSRDSGGTTLSTAQTNSFGVGILCMIDGQSNGVGMSSSAGGTAPTLAVAEWTGSAWTTSLGGAGERAFAQSMASLAGCVVGIANSAVGATGIGQHTPPSGTQWTDTTAMISAIGGDIEAMLWTQGESNAGTTDVSAAYQTDLEAIADALLTLLGRTSSQFRLFVGVTGRNEGSTQGNSTGWQSARVGQANAAAANAAIDISHDCIDLSMTDGVHYDVAGYSQHGWRFARSVAKWLGFSAYDARGPRVASATLVGSTVTVAFTLNGSTALTGTGTLTGWEFFNGTTWAAASDAARSGNTVTFTGAGATQVRHLYGQDPDVSNVVRGDVKPESTSPTNLPVEPTRIALDVTPVALPRCTLTLTTNGTTPAASVTGISWAWYDAAPPTLSALPAVTGTGASTDASGVFDVELTTSTLTTGQTGTLLAIKSNGTAGSTANSAFCAPVVVS